MGREGDDLADAVRRVPAWRHRIDLGSGVVTPGTEDCAAELERLRLPSDHHGMRVLDIGCSDGFYSFESERRGAEVVAVDDESSLLADGTNGFGVAAAALGSSVEYRAADVEELDASDVGTFDVILFVNVLYHLRNPHRALESIASVAKPGALLVLKTYYRTDLRWWVRGRCLGVDLDRRPKWWYFPGDELGGDPTNWWAPNRAAVLALLDATGWQHTGAPWRWRDRLYVHARRR
jgi:tRNA (mo5U34)-methyltransferase